MTEKIRLTYVGRDSFCRPVYEADGHYYVDVDPRRDMKPSIFTKYRDEFNGEPCDPVQAEFVFYPCRDTWY